MIYIFIFFLNFFITTSIFGEEVEIIELHNQVSDTILIDSVKNNADIEKNVLIDSTNNNSNESEELLSTDNLILDESNNEDEVTAYPDFWERSNKDEIIFLLDNINLTNSKILNKILIDSLSFSSLPPVDFTQDDFNRNRVLTLIRLGQKNKAFEIISSFNDIVDDEFYNLFKLNYHFSSYDLNLACDFNDSIDKKKSLIDKNFLLKVDIFCLFLQEKLDEANLLYSLLEESEIINDEYFKYIFKFLKNTDNLTYETSINNNLIINENLIYLYSAMHRVGNIPLNEKFLKIDPINLSMPIILSKSTNISLRLQAAHAAYNNELLGIDSLAALYQTVDFSFDELNDSSILASELEKKVELGMAYYYQLANIQILPITRLEALINFWKFAEKHNLKKIAYNLSNKILDSIEPSNELAEFGATIAKTYIYNRNFEKAEKWLLFSESFFNNDNNDIKLVSSKLLYNLFYVNKSEEFIEALMSGLQNFNNQNDDNNFVDNEILFTIFSILNDIDPNPFILNKNIYDSRFIPSIYIMNKIRTAIKTENQSEILLSIIASIEGKKWSQLHPEHLRLVLIGLREYKNGLILNEIILEILEKNKII